MHTEKAVMHSAIGCDHAGFDLYQQVLAFWKSERLSFLDLGTHTCDSTDYPLYAHKVCEAILRGECYKGLLICNSGIGMAIAANRFKGIRAVWADRPEIVYHARKHNNANVLCVGAMWTNLEQLIEMWQMFVDTPFDDAERHVRRLLMMDNLG